MSRKPWMVPIQYTDERFVEPEGSPPATASMADDEDADERDGSEIEERLSRPSRGDARTYDCNDTTPLDYSKGPLDSECGVEDRDDPAPDDVPVPYENGPQDEQEFGIDDDTE
jgi:hypothetical protein